MVKLCILCREIFVKGANRSFHKFPHDLKRRLIWCQKLGIDPYQLPRYSVLCSDHFSPADFIEKPSGLMYLRKEAVPIKPLPDNTSKPLENPTTLSLNLSDDSSDIPPVSSNSSETIYYNPSPTSEIYTIKSENDEEEVYTIDCVEEEVCEGTDLTEMCRNSVFTNEVEMPTAEPIEDEVEYLSDSSTLSAISENLSERESPLGDTPNISTSAQDLQLEEFPKKRKLKRYFGDCSADDLDCPNQAQTNWHIAKRTILNQKAKIRNLQQQNRRLRSRIQRLNSLLKYIFQNYEFKKKD